MSKKKNKYQIYETAKKSVTKTEQPEKDDQEWVAKSKNSSPPKITGSTRCIELGCYKKLPLTDWSDPDYEIALHGQRAHGVPMPSYYTPSYHKDKAQ